MRETIRSPGFWALALGATGGAAGFFGPMLLNPGANQGPMLGIFITGPGGVVAGLALGFLFRVLPFTDGFRARFLTTCCVSLGLGVLWFALPEPATKSRVIEGTIAACRSTADAMPERITHWHGRIAQVTWAEPRAGWIEDTRRMLRESPGVLVEIDVARSNAILEHRKPWNRGRLSAQGWKNVRESIEYFGGGTCENYPIGREVVLAPESRPRDLTRSPNPAWPPDDLPNFLGVQVLEAVPANYQRVIRERGQT
jgi:hypothetical protein